MKTKDSVQTIDICQLKKTVCSELKLRRCRWSKFSYPNRRNEKPDLYGVTGAVNIYAILGQPLGALHERQDWAKNIKKFYRRKDGYFMASEDIPEHALCMAIQALNLVGGEIPKNISPLAPLDVDDFRFWFELENWGSTHKRLWGGTAPLLADGLPSSAWIECFIEMISAKISPNSPKETWCHADSPSWKVISSIYHILQIFDAGSLPYPFPKLLLTRLLELDWHVNRNHQKMTFCTDGDWAWMLVELCKLEPAYFGTVLFQIKSVGEQRVKEWNSQSIDLPKMSTHHIYCYLWVTALFQHLDRGLFQGPWLYDTLNDPCLFRLGFTR